MADQNYLITARKYRPLLFNELVAQEHVTETLKNAIRLDRLAHAYMFTGPRGVGKTTAARILAKAINCTTPPEERTDRAEPCRACQSCLSFEEGRNLNIMEMDAASNRKVDDARDLRDTVRIPPQGARMKVYIIDEVHMLTPEAFNTLLKTLEEPPPYALFILATTEPHKVLPTIQSRCQRFDFRRIAVPEIISRLKEICDIEKISADEPSLMLIARKGDGALRDALSVFDQAVSLCGAELVYEEIIKALGVVDADLYFDVTDATANNDAARMVRIVEEIVNSGYDLQEFLDGLAEHLRNMLVIKTVGDRSLIEATSRVQERYENEAGRFSESVLLRLVHIVGETGDTLRNTRQPRLRLEMALLKMTSLPSALDVRAALEKIDRLEKLVSRLPNQAVSDPQGQRTQSVEERPAPSSAEKSGPAVEEGVRSDALVPPETEVRSAEDHAPAPVDTPPQTAGDDASPTSSPIDPPGRTTASDVSAEPITPGARETVVPARGTDSPSPKLPFDAPALTRTVPRTENQAPTSASKEVVLESSNVAVLEQPGTLPDELISAWDQTVEEVMENQIRLGSLLRHTRLVSLDGDIVLIEVPDSFHERMLRSERHLLAQKLSGMSKLEIKDIHFDVSATLAESLEDPNDDQFDARAALMKKCEENPAVQSLVERFGGEVVW